MAGFVVPLVTAALGSLGGLFGNKNKPQETTQNTTNNSSTQGYQNTTHNFTGEQKTLIDKIMQSLAGQKSFDSSGYVGNGLQSINQGNDALQRSVKNTVAARGLSFSPAGFNPVMQTEANRIGQQNQFLETVPQAEQQFNQVNYENLLKGFGIMPTDSSSNTGSATNSTSSMKGTNLQPGNPTGGAITGGGAGFIQGGGLDAILNLFKKSPSGGAD